MNNLDLHESTSPVAIAVAQTRAVAEALLSLGGSGTTDQISAACDLPKSVVTRRLMNSAQREGGWPCYFRRNAATGVWTLTEDGKRVAQG